jgi:hypothetical protein
MKTNITQKKMANIIQINIPKKGSRLFFSSHPNFDHVVKN